MMIGTGFSDKFKLWHAGGIMKINTFFSIGGIALLATFFFILGLGNTGPSQVFQDHVSLYPDSEFVSSNQLKTGDRVLLESEDPSDKIIRFYSHTMKNMGWNILKSRQDSLKLSRENLILTVQTDHSKKGKTRIILFIGSV